MEDVRFTIKDELLYRIEKGIKGQTSKGVKTYGQTLDECSYDEYDWLEMANQELIDLAQYQQKEIRRQRKIIKKREEEIFRLLKPYNPKF